MMSSTTAASAEADAATAKAADKGRCNPHAVDKKAKRTVGRLLKSGQKVFPISSDEDSQSTHGKPSLCGDYHVDWVTFYKRTLTCPVMNG